MGGDVGRCVGVLLGESDGSRVGIVVGATLGTVVGEPNRSNKKLSLRRKSC